MQKEYTLRIKEKSGEYSGTYYSLQRQYWIFWITVENFRSAEDALAFDYCRYLRKKALIKEVRRRLKKPHKVTCECPPKENDNA